MTDYSVRTIVGLASAPGSPANGQLYYDTSLNTLRVYNNGAWANLPGSFDRLSPLANSEVSVTTTATATISKIHVCSGTSANYTVTLPSPSGNAGKSVGFRMAPGLTKLVTLDAGAGVTINGQSTTLSGAINNSVTSITVASATGFPAYGAFVIQIDSEQMLVTAGNGTTTWTVRRGVNSTTAASHSNAVAVDWQRTRVTWANESAILLSDGSNWFKVGGNTAPMMCGLYKSTDYTLATTSVTKYPLDSVLDNNTGAMADTANNQIKVLRTSSYLLHGLASYSSYSGRGDCRFHKNGSDLWVPAFAINGYAETPTTSTRVFLVSGDTIQLYVFQNSGSNVTVYGGAANTQLYMTEVPTW